MRVSVAILLLLGIVRVPGGQENPPIQQAVPQSAGLQVGQKAPAFTLPDQFGHEQSNDTLKGSKGIVILFFRSADW
jgi:cytochrome oxidase Cu insertion factor (SCO1/SenC/PrrC family)